MRRAIIAAAALTIGCGTPTPRVPAAPAVQANPLGPSYVLLPLPGEEDTLLGRILPSPPAPGRTLEETARANPCAEFLSPPKTAPLASTFEDAQDLQLNASARASLGTFGFAADVNRATHFLYKLATAKRAAVLDTVEYATCCKEKGCGYGYVSALVYGDGEYSTAEETTASGSVNVAVVGSAGGDVRLRVLHKRNFRGWLAAVVTVTDPERGAQLDPFGTVAKQAGIAEATVSETVKQAYDADVIHVRNENDGYVFVDGRGTVITENEFIRRYRAVTGSSDLDDLEQRRNKPALYAVGGVTLLAGVAAIWGALNLKRHCDGEDIAFTAGTNTCLNRVDLGAGRGFATVSITKEPVRENTAAAILLGGGGTVAVLGIAGTVVLLAMGEGGPQNHYLSARDAAVYAEQHNRALLRSTVKQVQRTHESRGPSLQPFLGWGLLGLQGQF